MSSISFNIRVGTLRGMHYQVAPHEEVKLIRCTRGAIYDVLVDLRPTSPTFKKWFSFELTQENARQLYVPGGIAHGFQTLKADTEVSYQISEVYHPESARGIHWQDKELDIKWPIANPTMSARDRLFSPLSS
jgi:dTDP-4-dehydrorhamnose 3,5-epimerase